MPTTTANAQIADDLTTHTVNILRVGEDLRQAVFDELRRLESRLTASIAELPSTATTFTRTRLTALLAQTRATINNTYAVIAANNGKALANIGKAETLKSAQIVDNGVGAEVMSVATTAEQMQKLAEGTLLTGKFQKEWWAKQSADVRDRFEVAMRQGVAQGEGVDQLVRRVRGTAAAGYNDGIMGITRAQARALVRTSVIATSNAARILSFENNQDVIKGIQWRSTLDDRTTDICIALDGKQWRLPDYEPIGHDIPFPGPTAHWNCRSTQVAITRSWDELASNAAPRPSKPPPKITSDNIEEFRGKVDSTKLASVSDKAATAFTEAPGAQWVPLDKLVSAKNELLDPAFRDGLKADPRITAGNAMFKVITEGGKRRAPLEVYMNKDGTYQIIDGNATAQAAMLAGWDKVPVVVVPKPTVAEPFNVEKAFRKNLRAKGFTDDQIEVAVANKRVTMDGVATDPETFDAFLKKQTTEFQNDLLGVQRADMWRQNKITLTSLIDQTHRPLTLDELQATIDNNTMLSRKPIVEGEHGMGTKEQELLRQSLTHGIQLDARMYHVYNMDTGENLTPIDQETFPIDPTNDLIKKKGWSGNRIEIMRNGTSNTDTFTSQEIGQFGKLPQFQMARIVRPNGQVVTLEVKPGVKPVAGAPQTVMANSISRIVNQANTQPRELRIAIDNKSGQVLAENVGTKLPREWNKPTEEVGWGPNDEAWKKVGGAESITDMHSHPEPVGPSDGDWGVFGFGNVRRMIVAEKGGKLWTLEKTDKWDAMDWKQRTPLELRNAYNEFIDSIEGEALTAKSTEEHIADVNRRMADKFGVKLTESNYVPAPPALTTFTNVEAHKIVEDVVSMKNTGLSESTKLERAVKAEGSLRLSTTPVAAIRPPVGTYRQTFDDIATKRLDYVATTPERLAKTIQIQARKEEPKITADMVRVAQRQDGEMVGLGQSLKTEASLVRKIKTDAAEKSYTIQYAASKISDAVRYTIVFPEERWTESFKGAMDYFRSLGYYNMRCNNFWSDKPVINGYVTSRALNAKMTHPSGVTIEVQFHTPESRYQLHETESHAIYKEQPTDEAGKLSRLQRLHALLKDIIVPKGAAAIGDNCS